MDEPIWTALTVVLTILFGLGTWAAYRRRGLGAGLTGAGITLLPLAAYLTNTLRLFVEVGEAIGSWAGGMALSPRVWVGIVIAAVGVLLFLGGRAVSARGAAAPPAAKGKREGQALPSSAPAAGGGKKASGEDDFADVEAMLRDRGIT